MNAWLGATVYTVYAAILYDYEYLSPIKSQAKLPLRNHDPIAITQSLELL